jgi:ADP-ribose pyrophosphatase YjhB (NUDIX family)
MIDPASKRPAELKRILDADVPAVVIDECWDWYGVPLPLRIASYISSVRLPDEFITSVRCLVGVSDSLLVCETPLDVHVWPGGRREQDESLSRTAVREVLEETGWVITEESLVPLGFLHFEHQAVPPPDYPFPSPDFLQLIFGAMVSDGACAPERWADQEGWEVRSDLVDRESLKTLPLSPTQWPFIEAYFSAAI